MTKRFKAAIFDMDGVLADTDPFYEEIEKKLFRYLGLDISKEEHDTFKGVAADRMWEILKERYKLSQNIDYLLRMTSNEVIPFFNSLNKIELYKGIFRLIEKFRENGIPIALASSSYPEVIEIILQKSDLKPFFRVVVNSRMAGASKPDPAIYILTAKLLGIDPDRCLAIEDSFNGIKSARDAGMFCAAVDFPENKMQDKSQANLLIDDYLQFLEMLRFTNGNTPGFYISN